MDEARQMVAKHGSAVVERLTTLIQTTLSEGNDKEALRLDELLQRVEALIETKLDGTSEAGTPSNSDKRAHS